MARISGVDIPRDKRVVISLTYIYGIGRPTAIEILEKAGVDQNKRVKNLTEEEFAAIRREVAMNIKRLMEIGCYRGIRHRKGLPVRGQNTRCNARTRKGKAKTVANKKK